LVTMRVLAAVTLVFGTARAQKAGTVVPETHPTISIQECTASGQCQTQAKSVTVDANWRWLEDGGVNCFTGNLWNETDCPSTEEGSKTCSQNCALEGATYEESYGIVTTQDSLQLDFVTVNNIGAVTRDGRRTSKTQEELTNVGSRTYMMKDDNSYEMFHLKNKEFTFTVDVSAMPCGLNGALYFVEMEEDGGLNQYGTNQAGAKYGTGYCDAQCPHDLKFINGEANVIDWVPSDADPNAGTGYYGTCCVELDIWEANAISQAYTPHTCSTVGQQRCSGSECGDIDDSNPESRYTGLCDKDGCDLNPYRYGIKDFYGPGSEFTINTEQPITVVTQFVTTDGTDEGDLREIKRFYVQNGKKVESPNINIPVSADGHEVTYNSITDDFCQASRDYFMEPHNDFKKHGGMKAMGESMDRGHVLVMSMWDDHYAHMLWLDSAFPTDPAVANDPGVVRGPCPTTSGDPTDVEVNSGNSTVIFSDIKFGAIGSTFKI